MYLINDKKNKGKWKERLSERKRITKKKHIRSIN